MFVYSDGIQDAEKTVGNHSVCEEIIAQSGQLHQITISYEEGIKTLWVTLNPEPKPVFTYALLESITRLQRAIWGLWGGRYHHCPIRFLAYRASGEIFTLGGDIDFYLDCLAANDRRELEEYARVSVEGACWNANGLNGLLISLAAVQGKAVGGGIDAARSCNLLIAEEQASFCYPEIKFNHFPIAAVPVLSRVMTNRDVEAVLTSGDEYSADQFERIGGLDAVVPTGNGEAWIRDYAARTLPRHVARTALFSIVQAGRQAFRQQLDHSAKLWIDCMMRLQPLEISKLQRIARAQERMLAHLYRAR